MIDPETQLEQARQLTSRLERLSADSIWARRASGYRASLLKSISRIEVLNNQLAQQEKEEEIEQALEHLDGLLLQGQKILELAARDLIRSRIRRGV
jgi:gamma-glutamyl-gamma-aminobutyrate hydrolase PuuD